MSRSYKKNVFGAWTSAPSMKSWRTQENRRLRHNAKQLINTCLDYDKLIIPVLNDFDTLWGSPHDGRKHYIGKSALNQCAVDEQRYKATWGYSPFKSFNGEHYTKSSKCCRCYTNKRSWYWRTKRK